MTSKSSVRYSSQNYWSLFSALLSSSCCVIQLVLNLFSFSCAGFSVLTPFRPFLVVLTITVLSYTLFSQGLNFRTVSNVVFCVLLMQSQDIVDHFNQSGRALANVGTTHYLLGIDGMSCMACANRVKQTLETSLAVQEAKIFFENASAIVTVTSKGDKHAKHIVDLVHNLHDKYRAKIINSW